MKASRVACAAVALAVLDPASTWAVDAGATTDVTPSLILVVGAPGTPSYGQRFRETAARWQKAAARAHAQVTLIGPDLPPQGRAAPPLSDKATLEAALRAAAPGTGPLWLVLVGHGTHDGRSTRFNLRGTDVSAVELQSWCKTIRRPLVFVNGASASGPFVPALSGPNRILITATKSGNETSAPRFGAIFAESVADPRADLDRDGGTSVLEAFLHASKRVEASFAEQGLLSTEHPLLEDNADGLGTSPDFFRGLVAAARAVTDAPRDGARAGQTMLVPTPAERALPAPLRSRRDELEIALLALRDQRSKLPESTYFTRLERLLQQLGRVYQQADAVASPR